jgi:hypothetical protein
MRDLKQDIKALMSEDFEAARAVIDAYGSKHDAVSVVQLFHNLVRKMLAE